MTTHPISKAPANAVASERSATARHRGTPREVWPLLGTIGATELAMAGIILWFSAPSAAPTAIAGLGIGAVAVALLALALRVIGKLAVPKPASHPNPHVR